MGRAERRGIIVPRALERSWFHLCPSPILPVSTFQKWGLSNHLRCFPAPNDKPALMLGLTFTFEAMLVLATLQVPDHQQQAT